MRVQVSDNCMEMHLPRPRVSRTPARPGKRRTLLRLPRGRSGWSNWLTFLCLGLVLLSGTIQAEHVHLATPGSPDTHAACSLCVTAHVGVEAAAAPLLHTAATVIGQAEARPARPAFPAPKNFDLYTRPPPTDPTLA